MSTVLGVSDQSYLSSLEIDNEASKSEATADKDMFMKLMLAQLQNQNPLDPSDGTEFVSQLAQFSSLEGITNLNSSVQEIAGMYRSTQALQATALVGRDVLIGSDKAYLDYTGPISGVIHPEGVSAGNVIANITNASGQVVKAVDIGNIGSEDTPFEWDGTDNNGNRVPPGVYKIAIQGTVAGDVEALNLSTHAKVSSVSIVNNSGDMLLNLNGLGQISSNDIKQVR